MRIIGKVYQVNNSVTFRGISIGPEEFLNQMVKALGIVIDRHPNGRLHLTYRILFEKYYIPTCLGRDKFNKVKKIFLFLE